MEYGNKPPFAELYRLVNNNIKEQTSSWIYQIFWRNLYLRMQATASIIEVFFSSPNDLLNKANQQLEKYDPIVNDLFFDLAKIEELLQENISKIDAAIVLSENQLAHCDDSAVCLDITNFVSMLQIGRSQSLDTSNKLKISADNIQLDYQAAKNRINNIHNYIKNPMQMRHNNAYYYWHLFVEELNKVTKNLSNIYEELERVNTIFYWSEIHSDDSVSIINTIVQESWLVALE